MSKFRLQKAFGLVEVLIALLLVSSTLVLALTSVSKSLRIAKENEIRDSANAILLRGLEFKSLDLPQGVVSDINRTKQYGGVFARCYKLDSSLIDINKVELIEVAEKCSVDSVIGECIEGYKLTNTQGVEICNQIVYSNADYGEDDSFQVVEPLNNKIRITSTVIFYLDGNKVSESLVVYKNL